MIKKRWLTPYVVLHTIALVWFFISLATVFVVAVKIITSRSTPLTLTPSNQIGGPGYVFTCPKDVYPSYSDKPIYWQFRNDTVWILFREFPSDQYSDNEILSLVPQYASRPQDIKNLDLGHISVSTATYKMSNSFEGSLLGEKNNEKLEARGYLVHLPTVKLFFFGTTTSSTDRLEGYLLEIVNSLKTSQAP